MFSATHPLVLALAAMLSSQAIASPAPQGAGNAGTACCPGGQGCTTISGTSDAGTPWCFGYQAGNQEWSQKDADVAKCIVDLHVNQDTACISKAGSSCDLNDSQLNSVQEDRLSGSHQLSEENAEAMRAAMQAMVGTKWDGTEGRGFIDFAQVADNGAGARGVQARFGDIGDC